MRRRSKALTSQGAGASSLADYVDRKASPGLRSIHRGKVTVQTASSPSVANAAHCIMRRITVCA